MWSLSKSHTWTKHCSHISTAGIKASYTAHEYQIELTDDKLVIVFSKKSSSFFSTVFPKPEYLPPWLGGRSLKVKTTLHCKENMFYTINTIFRGTSYQHWHAVLLLMNYYNLYLFSKTKISKCNFLQNGGWGIWLNYTLLIILLY